MTALFRRLTQLPKVVRAWCALRILTSKCASRHNDGTFSTSHSTSRSGPRMVCFAHFDLEMCFTPQRRALLEMCFAPQRRATFRISSDHMAPRPPLKQAYFSTLRSHKSLEKHRDSRLSYLLAHLHLLSSHSFSSLIFSLRLFSSLTLPTSAFPSVHIAFDF